MITGRGLTQVAVALAALSLSGCATFSIGEADVFAPTAFDADEAGRTGEKIRDEHAFSDAAVWNTTWERKASEGWLTSPPPAFIPTTVTHGRTAGGLAWSRLTREGADRPLILRCGGNASTRQLSGFVYSVAALPYGDVILFDYPGSGETGGVASATSFLAAADAAVGLVKESRAPGQKLVLWGHSLGGPVCAELATRFPGDLDGVVLETTARNAREVAKEWSPPVLDLFLRIEVQESLAAYDVVDALAPLGVPVLVLGAKRDTTLPVKLARSLAKALKEAGVNAEYVEFPEAEHVTMAAQPGLKPVLDAYFGGLR
jgi:pimeloyl-ACP methyl ester carboxylesterase